MKTFRKTAFTLAEGATHVDMFDNISNNATNFVEGATHVDICDNIRKCAFTLAEVLITLGIIGVVAAITIPPLITNVTERINSERQANIALKFTKAMENMKALGLLHEYESTDAFVDELQKHMKIAKRCSASNIADCWPTSTVIDTSGKEFEVSKAKQGKNLSINTNTTDNVGLVLDDGAAVILTYNQNSEGMDETDAVRASNKPLPVGFGKTKDFAYTTSVTGSIDFVMDVNGGKGPNSETVDNKMHDIRSFKSAHFGTGCAGVEIPSIGCVVNIGYVPCISEIPFTYNNNCWAAAREACKEINMNLPDKNTLLNIYSKKSEYSELPQTGWFWVYPESDLGTAWDVDFSNGFSEIVLKYAEGGALCIGN